ncbi:hypothetical protein [Sulfurirhabdus autotrophica]|uniref:Uncharacterized protein n=1 Tax=Sulfurirhabdus autotrophica TaxID=1706046 RepID=A0A4R3Y1B6_9PROT|nr:hypothetical protein [Sulfurirhabdus autotrophica]TCV85905.1 hypothetical protein EDC63_108113 [Sulfurirhabdus autotrophica]
MLRIVNIEEIQNMLSSISGLVDLQQRRDANFDDKVKLWLAKLEKMLERNRIMQVGEVATLRGLILSAENGITPPGIEIHGNSTKRKIIEAAVTFSLRQASSVVSTILQKEVDRISDAERMMRQIIAMAKSKGLIPEIPEASDHTEVLKFIWRTLSANPEIAPGTTNVEGLVGPHDALIILDRIIASDLQTTKLHLES